MATSDDDQGEPSAEKSLFAGLTPYSGFRSAAGEEKIVHIFECGDCAIVSGDVGSYSLLTIVFLPFIIIIWRVDTVIKCPRCMRLHILSRLPLITLASNLLSPIVFFWWLGVFLKTFKEPRAKKGESART
jgi:hypothetical protein